MDARITGKALPGYRSNDRWARRRMEIERTARWSVISTYARRSKRLPKRLPTLRPHDAHTTPTRRPRDVDSPPHLVRPRIFILRRTHFQPITIHMDGKRMENDETYGS